MSEHTKGPWVTFEMGGQFDGGEEQTWFGICQEGKSLEVMMGDDGPLIAAMSPADDEQDQINFKHIVACVNALEGYNPAAVRHVVEALRLIRDYGCPVCNGDCASANPPMAMCPMDTVSKALAALEGGAA